VNQSLPLAEQLKNLVHLQELDLKIDSVKKNQNSLPSTLKSIDDALGKVKTHFEVKKAQLVELEKLARQTHAALELHQERSVRSQTKLESVQNTQEFQAASKEIEQLKKLALSLEEQKKKSDSDLELCQKEFVVLQADMDKLDSERGSQSETVSGQNQVFAADLNQLISERAQYLPGIEVRLLSQYNRIRSARAGIGIVPALGGRCKACNMMVPPQLYNELQRGHTLHSCPSCNRILFVPVSADEEVAVQPHAVHG
jgi:predicted  nucleic acid-binding Zn-ribbon protein